MVLIPKSLSDKVIAVIGSEPKSENQISLEVELKQSRVEFICRDLKNRGLIKIKKIEVARNSYVRGWILC